ncbi:aldo/keto reductase [Streptomyces sp. NPDC005438]|uniref:aldo/keto reductase n=1 Tax=Streptomyces sp. NPDC005438 TaxID=3156880 RepID=UPI0033B145F1
MERRTIGAGALEVGAIGLGCMPLSCGYPTTAPRGRESAVRAVHAALDQGSTLLDTADAYGPFTNELLIGRALRERPREDAVLSTKCGLLIGESHVVANGRPSYVRRACDASLRRLGTDTIDLYQLHRVDPEVPVEETWGAMSELVGAGKVRALGLSAVGAHTLRPADRAAGRSPVPRRPRGDADRAPRGDGAYRGTLRVLERVQQVFPVSAVQVELSVWARDALTGLLPWCAARGVGLLAAMPLGHGFLTGTLTVGGGFTEDDVRARHPRFTAEMMAANQPIVAGLRRVATRHGAASCAQVALAWLLAQHPGVVPVPGTKHAEWAVQNARAAELRLTAEDLAEIRSLPEPQESWE